MRSKGSLMGSQVGSAAGPHVSLASLCDYVITQNIDGLHQRAGSRRVRDTPSKPGDEPCHAGEPGGRSVGGGAAND